VLLQLVCKRARKDLVTCLPEEGVLEVGMAEVIVLLGLSSTV